jgi:HlyD family secretion protein
VKRNWKWILGIGGTLVVAGAVFASVKMSQRGVVTVQTGKVIRQDLTSLVTASGEIKPRDYYNVGANVMGRIIEIGVKEGDKVRRGQVLARLESIQAGADVQAQQASLNSALADSAAAASALKAMGDNILSAQATVDRSKSDLDKAKLDLDRGNELWKDKLIAKQDLDTRKSAFDSAAATLRGAQATLNQMKSQRDQAEAQLSGADKRVAQSRAMLTRVDDVLAKHMATSPIDGIVTNLPVRMGETVVPGIQNSAASLIMTIADMSLITSEVKVDETDIVNVKLGQAADITIDAMPSKTFRGHVTEIGNTAILRSTGLAASQSAVSSQEAKDFKVVIALDNPPDDIRPGLSCTSKIITATRTKAVSLPIQALTVRQRGDLEPDKPGTAAVEASTANDAAAKAKKEELQGVFVITKTGLAQFREVKTGITGTTDIEVLDGLKDGEEIITGSYKVIRTLKNETKVKVDNQAPAKTDS